MSELPRKTTNSRHKSQRQSPTGLVLRPFFQKEEGVADRHYSFKRQILSKLKQDPFLPFRLDTDANRGDNIETIINHRKRINTESTGKKKSFLPELQNNKRDNEFKHVVGGLKVESRRMLDRVNQLYQILKFDNNTKVGNRSKRTKREDSNPEAKDFKVRSRHQTLDNLPMTIEHPITIDVTQRRKSNTQNAKRTQPKKSEGYSPKPGLLFTFYPHNESVNEFLH